jgi:hypothetical protein
MCLTNFKVGDMVYIKPWDNMEDDYGTGVGIGVIDGLINQGHYPVIFGFPSSKPNERTSVNCRRIVLLSTVSEAPEQPLTV